MATRDAMTTTLLITPDGSAAARAVRDGDLEQDWDVVEHAVIGLATHDWPAVVVPASASLLASPSVAYRLRDLAERYDADPARVWLQVNAAGDALGASGVITALARRHRVGCAMDVAPGMDDRALLPHLSTIGITFISLGVPESSSVADDLEVLILGRSLTRRAHASGMTVIGPGLLDADLTPTMP